MKLVIGGYAQGKLEYVLRKYGEENCLVWDGLPLDGSVVLGESDPQKAGCAGKLVVVNGFHQWVKQRIAEEGNPEEEVLLFLEKYPDCIVISDEIGNGIVPIDRLEREWRERTGRILVELARKAKGVERILCGIGQKIK